MGKTKFVSKKKCATFAVGCADTNHSSGVASSSGPVFVRIDGGTASVPGFTDHDHGVRTAENWDDGGALSRYARAELGAMGLADDGYDYSRHLRTIDANGIFLQARNGNGNSPEQERDASPPWSIRTQGLDPNGRLFQIEDSDVVRFKFVLSMKPRGWEVSGYFEW